MKITLKLSVAAIMKLATSEVTPRNLRGDKHRIHGGEEVSNFYDGDRFQYFVHADTKPGCGGMLIADNIVLSAAHCENFFKESVKIGKYEYGNDPTTSDSNDSWGFPVLNHLCDKFDSRTGKYITELCRTVEQPQDESLNILKKIVHPKYEDSTIDNDFMIIVLEEKSALDPICLAEENVLIGENQKLHVYGFGETENAYSSDSLLEVDVDYISNEECQTLYDSLGDNTYDFSITNNMMCADSSNEGKDSCYGDSGGPLIRKGSSNEKDMLVGVVSWGVGCATYPGVYSRISSQVDWIKEQVGDNDGTLPKYC